ncbi:MAG: DUF6520 family protein [Lutibacter sp.]
MKTNFLKRFMMPLVIMIFGIAGAFVTTAMSSTKTMTEVPGYRFVSMAQPCHEEQLCTTVVTNNICTAGGQNLWGKEDPYVNVCNVPLFRITN